MMARRKTKTAAIASQVVRPPRIFASTPSQAPPLRARKVPHLEDRPIASFLSRTTNRTKLIIANMGHPRSQALAFIGLVGSRKRDSTASPRTVAKRVQLTTRNLARPLRADTVGPSLRDGANPIVPSPSPSSITPLV